MNDLLYQLKELKALLEAHNERSTVATDATIRASVKDVLNLIEGFEIDEEWELGQMNGVGTIEPMYSREWFTEKNTDGHRKVFTITGPWEPWSWAQERPDLVVPPKVKVQKTVELYEREVEKAEKKLAKAKLEAFELEKAEDVLTLSMEQFVRKYSAGAPFGVKVEITEYWMERRSSGRNFELQDQDEQAANNG